MEKMIEKRTKRKTAVASVEGKGERGEFGPHTCMRVKVIKGRKAIHERGRDKGGE